MEEPIDYRKLYERYLDGRLTPEERAALLLHFHRRGEATELRVPIETSFDTLPPESWENQAQVQETFQRVGTNLREAVYQSKRTPGRRLRWLPYAAAVLLVASVVGWWAIGIRPSVSSNEIVDIQPGGNKATLTLADGRVINLDEAQTGIIVGAVDITYDDGSAVSPANSPHAGLTTYDLQLTTPKGGTYQITLPDGSKVWLNANSTLKYPSRFTGHSREVILDGEAFFDIQEIQGARDTRVPFKVLTSGQTVEVLGTQFNVSAYADEPETKTTLVEGRVSVETDGARLQLVPGEQGTSDGKGITKTEVNTEQYTAWRDGWISFQDKPFDQIMREVERWYGIEVRYEGHIPREIGYGMTKRTENLSVVLHLLESGGIRFRLDGRTLTILNQ